MREGSLLNKVVPKDDAFHTPATWYYWKSIKFSLMCNLL